MNHDEIKKNYRLGVYHGDVCKPLYWPESRPGGIAWEWHRYEPDERTLLPSGQYMVVWAISNGNGGLVRHPAFLNGYTRQDALDYVSKGSLGHVQNGRVINS